MTIFSFSAWKGATRALALMATLTLGLLPARAVEFVVLNTADSGAGSLRAAIDGANGDGEASTITFSSLFNTAQTINLETASGGFFLGNNNSLVITGPGADLLTVRPRADFALEVFTNNSTGATLSGLTVTKGALGILNNTGTTLTLLNCVVTANRNTNGGGIFNSGTLRMTGCVVSANQAFSNGGGISSVGSLSMLNCSVSGNTSTSNGNALGGGIYASGGTVNLTGCTVSGNTAMSGSSTSAGRGGGINVSNTTLNASNCTVFGNTATATGTGTSNWGGGIFLASGTVNLRNCSVSGNTAKNVGGGLFNSGGTFNVGNTIVAGNTLTTGTRPDVFGDFVSQGSNLIGNATGATGTTTFGTAGTDDQINVPAGFDPAGFKNYGGTTETLALAANSSAINRGNNALIPDDTLDSDGDGVTTGEKLPFDQRGTGFARIVNTMVDIGAFEVQAPPPSVSIAPTLTRSEGNSGVNTFLFTVTRSGDRTGTSTVAYSVGGGSATTGVDYGDAIDSDGGASGTNGGSPGTINFIAGQSSASISIPVVGDQGLEPDETFTVTLSAPTGATLGTTEGVATIQNDDSGLVVTTTSDAAANGNDNDNTLREAITTANGDGAGSAISFDASAFAAPRKTITLGGTELPAIADDGATSITAPAAGVEVSGGGQSRVFSVADGADVTLSGLLISGGMVDGGDIGGGAILNRGILTVRSSTLSGNRAPYGGAIENFRTLTVTSSTLSGNTATEQGGGIYNDPGALLTVTNSTLSDNSVPAENTNGSGGAISNQDAEVTIINSTLSGNSAAFSGAIDNLPVSTLTLLNSTLSGNSARNGSLFNGSGATLIIGNTILNRTLPGNNLVGPGTLTSQGGNLSNDATGPTSGTGDRRNIADLKLDTLKSNGGPTPTQALLPGSPAIDMGLDANATGLGLTTDQRGSGFARIIGARVDIGAFEAPLPPLPSVTSITRLDPNPNQNPSVRFLVTFNQSVTGVDAADFALTLTGLSGGTIAVDGSGSGSGATRTVTVSNVNGPSGRIGLNLRADASINGTTVSSGFTGGEIYTRNNLAASPVALISEFRFRGPTSDDEYVEIVNTTNAPLSIVGWTLRTNTGSGAEPTFQTATVPANTPAIPAFGHFLFTGTGYAAGALPSYGAGNLSLGADASEDSGAALVDLNGQIQDAVGFASGDPTLRKDAGLPSAPNVAGQYTWMRDFSGQFPKNTGVTTGDFVLLSTDGAGVAGTNGSIASQLGAPNPEGLASPTLANNFISVALLDPQTNQNNAPNRVRTGSGNAGNLLIRRTLRNNSSRAITKIRLIVTRITSQGSPFITAGQADVRLIGQPTEPVTVQGQSVTVFGTLLEAPSNTTTTTGTAPNTVVTGGGGGLGGSLAFDLVLATSLQPNQSRAYAFNLQVAQSGNFVVVFNLLANTTAATP